MDYFSFENFFDTKNFIAEEAVKDIWRNNPAVWNLLACFSSLFEKADLGRIEGKVDPLAYIVKPELISIGKGSVVEKGAYIEGPCIIGRDTIVRHGAYIRGGAVIGDGCVIGHATEVKGSLFFNGAKAPHFSYVGDSVIGNNVNLGAGVKCANFKLDEKNVFVAFEGTRYDTGLKKMGAIIGDGTKIGCNTVLSPGVIIGKCCLCYPSINVAGVIKEDSVVKPENRVLVKRLRNGLNTRD